MFDFHMHSHVSYDSEAMPLVMAQAAVERGLREICFTDHCDYHSDPAKPADAFVFSDYRKAYDGLEVPGLMIRKGLEFGLTEWNTEAFRRWESAYPFDFVMGSVHEVAGTDPYWPDYWTNDLKGDFRRYLEQVLRCVEVHNGFDVLGHLTYVCKSVHNPGRCDVPFEDHRELTDAIMQVLVRKGIGMEVNTSGVDRAGAFLPSEIYLRRFKELGGQIVTIGSDAHDPARVGQYAPRALDLVRDVFGYVCTFQNRQPIFHKL